MELARRVAAAVAEEGHLDAEEPLRKARLFTLLANAPRPAEVSGLLVRDAEGVPVAWTGRLFTTDPLPPIKRGSGVVTTAIHRALFAEEPVRRGDTLLGSVVVYSPFDLNYPLHNRFSSGGDYETEAARRYGLAEVRVATEPPGAGDARTSTAEPILNEAGEPVLWVSVTAFPGDVHLARVRHLRGTVRGVLVGAFLLFLVWLAMKRALRPDAGLLHLLLLALVLAAARFGLSLADFPGALFDGRPFDPADFSVLTQVFGVNLGFARSPGDLVLTGLAALGLVVAAGPILKRRADRLPEGRGRLLAGILLLPVSLGACLLGILAWLRLLHALTFYSTVEFFSDYTVIPGVAAVVLLLGLFLLTVSLVRVLSALLYLPALLVAGGQKRVFVPLFLTLPLLFLVLLFGTDLSPALSALSAACLTAAAALLVGWPVLGMGLRVAAITGIVSILTFPPLMQSIWREMGADVEEEAENPFRPAAAEPLKDLFDLDLDEMARDERLVRALTADSEKERRRTAFLLWAEGPLARRPYGVDIEVLDRSRKTVISQFDIDMPPRTWLPDPLPGSSPLKAFSSVETGEGELAGREFLVGTAPVFGRGGEFLAQLVVRMAMERGGAGAHRRPEILRYQEEGASPVSRRRPLHYCVFDRQKLIRTTNPLYPRVLRASPEVTRAIFTERRPRFWAREEIAGVYWMNLYRPRMEDGRIVGLYSVGFRSRELRTLFASFFKLLLVNSLAAFLGVLAVTAVTVRRFAPRFQQKLLISYVVVSAVPVLLLAEVNRSIARETVEEQMQDRLMEVSRLVDRELEERGIEENLAEAVHAGAGSGEMRKIVTDEELKEIGYRLGQEINLFLLNVDGAWGARLVASSEPGIFATELFGDRLPGSAWKETVLLERPFFSAPESVGSYSYMVGYTPVYDRLGAVAGTISLPMIYGQDEVDLELARRNSLILALYFLILILMVFIGMLLARRISSPIELLAEGTRRLSRGELSYRIPHRSRDEFGDLVRSFNQMTEDLRESRERVVKAEKDAAWREMAKQVAHEIKNPLTPMRLSAQQILKAHDDEHDDFEEILRRGLETIVRQTEALTRIAGEFSAFARLPRRRMVPVDPGEVMREVAGLYRGHRDMEVVEEIGDVPPVTADRDELRRVLVNLATNAVQAMETEGGPGRLVFKAGTAERDGEEWVRLTVADTGGGIPEEDRPRLFEPNFSTKTGGTGLGLAISRAVVTSFGGNIAVESEVGRGTTVTVLLPPAEADA